VTIATFSGLKKQWPVTFVVLLLFGLTLPLAAATSPNPSCPSAGEIILVATIDSRPKTAPVGTTVTTVIAVETGAAHTPVTLSPQTMSFRWASSAGEKIVENAPVSPAATGTYTYNQTIGDDFPTGTVTISVIACSCSDGKGNYGPVTDINSTSSDRLTDDSVVQIGATAATPSAGIPGFPMESILIGLVTASAILVLLRRRRTGDKTHVV